MLFTCFFRAPPTCFVLALAAPTSFVLQDVSALVVDQVSVKVNAYLIYPSNFAVFFTFESFKWVLPVSSFPKVIRDCCCVSFCRAQRKRCSCHAFQTVSSLVPPRDVEHLGFGHPVTGHINSQLFSFLTPQGTELKLSCDSLDFSKTSQRWTRGFSQDLFGCESAATSPFRSCTGSVLPWNGSRDAHLSSGSSRPFLQRLLLLILLHGVTIALA